MGPLSLADRGVGSNTGGGAAIGGAAIEGAATGDADIVAADILLSVVSERCSGVLGGGEAND